MEDKSAPRPGCNCDVCAWANRILEAQRRILEAQRRQDDDLAANYAAYLSGALVSRDARE